MEKDFPAGVWGAFSFVKNPWVVQCLETICLTRSMHLNKLHFKRTRQETFNFSLPVFKTSQCVIAIYGFPSHPSPGDG
jgi:hypothetical protein